MKFAVIVLFFIGSFSANVMPPPDKFGTYPSWWPTQKMINMPTLSASTSKNGPSFDSANPSSDPGGYTNLIYNTDATLNNQPALSETFTYYNQFVWKNMDFLGYVFLNVGFSSLPLYNCSSAGNLFDIEYFGTAGFGDTIMCTKIGEGQCCNQYFGFGAYYARYAVSAQNVAITTVMQVGACDLTMLDESLFCALSAGSGYCQERYLSRSLRQYIFPCLDNMYFFYVVQCPIYKAIGTMDIISIYEPPMFIEKSTVSDSLQIKAYDQINMQDKVCIPYSYFKISTSWFSMFELKTVLYITCYLLIMLR